MSKKWVSLLFSKFQARYPHKWISALGTPELITLAVDEWGKVLAGVTAEQVKRGLLEWDRDWPPSALEFRKACLGKGDALHNTAAFKPFVRLPKPERDVQVANDAIAAMRKSLGMKAV